MTTATPIDRLRAALLADEAAQLRLAPLADTATFLDAITAYAAELGLPITRDAFAAGLARAATPQMEQELPALRLAEAPPRHWLPVELKPYQGAIVIEWLHFAGLPLTDPFFEETWRKVRLLPFNRLMRTATPLSAIEPFVEAPPPDGLVFHMSRCGSTLVGQMLGAAPDHIVLAEPPVLDTVIQLVGLGQVSPAAIRAMAGALTRDRGGDARHRFIKLDAWHALVLPLLRGIWPGTPWTFLYRDPVEVLVSQQRRPGMHCRPGVLPLEAYGVDPAEGAAAEDYPAWILGQICSAAADAVDGDCLLLNYDQLPAALTDALLPHFGVAPDAASLDKIVAAGGRYSKAPGQAFTGDSAAKQREASPALRAAAAPLLATHARIEELRLAAKTPSEPVA
ncbi:aspartyl beta-hydroxylase [Sphingopyxis sp. OPL5]|uniref:aspartyl beta-hydroxylase n=1 Tax=Sphingopyxis sp. OPL5 TaxID=2486273 RepID=UPI00164CF90F|nr:aspartyl beta-hydroxylase [Sphingopyxis sp. OPL5]QNO26203.1 aspartyl beta-hydroxylase [Sphingopyxis sp. OPL5]